MVEAILLRKATSHYSELRMRHSSRMNNNLSPNWISVKIVSPLIENGLSKYSQSYLWQNNTKRNELVSAVKIKPSKRLLYNSTITLRGHPIVKM